MTCKNFSRQDSIFFRSIAAIMVIIAHYSNFLYEIYGNNIWNLLNKTGRYGVALFFLVSGYGLTKSIDGKDLTYHFLLHRIKAVYVPFLCLQIIALAVLGIPHSKMSGTDWFLYLIGIDYWYIIVILLLYCLFYISTKYFIKYQEFFLFLSVTALNIALALIGCEEWWYLTNYVFCMGVFLANYKKSGKVNNLFWAISFCTGFVISSIIYAKIESTFLHDLFKILAAICFAGFVWFVYAAFPTHICIKPLNIIGKCSLYIYIIHVQALVYLRNHALTSYAAMLISLVIVFVISLFCEKIFTGKIIAKHKQ